MIEKRVCYSLRCDACSAATMHFYTPGAAEEAAVANGFTHLRDPIRRNGRWCSWLCPDCFAAWEESLPVVDPDVPLTEGGEVDLRKFTMLRIQIREDREAGVIRAFFADGKGQRFEMATLNAQLAETCPEAFERWKELLTHALAQLIEESGVEVLGFREEQPGDPANN